MGLANNRSTAPAARLGRAAKLGLFRSMWAKPKKYRQPMTFPRALARHTRGAVNTMPLHFAGHAAFADLEHAGRKSGTVRHTQCGHSGPETPWSSA